MKKIFKMLISTVLCILSAIIIIPTAKGETSDTVSKMSLEEKIGQMINVEIRKWDNKDFTKMNSRVEDIIANNGIGGVTLFSENFSTTGQTLRLTTDLQNAALKSKNKIPLMISTDQEGGAITRLNRGTSLPGNMALGAVNSTNDARRAGDIIGSELSALGINTDFAPVLDVNSNPMNPVIGIRSFSSDPEIVKNMGNAYIQGLMDKYIVPTVKHFPGHGDTTTDTHTELSTVNKSLDELLKCELVPFMSSIPMGVDMVMTAHIQFPKVDNTTVRSKKGEKITVPATLSKKFVTDILRNQIGFKGVVTSDALNMKAITDNFSTSDACIMAINAGIDVLLMPVPITNSNSEKQLTKLINDIALAVKKGIIDENTIDASVRRILNLKEKYGILNYTAPNEDNALSVVGSQEHHNTEAEISAKAVTVLKNEDNILPFNPQNDSTVTLVSAYENEIPLFRYAMDKLSHTIGKVKYKTFCYNEDKKTSILDAVKKSDYTVVLSEMNSEEDLNSTSTTTTMTRYIMNTAKMNGKQCAVVSVSLPYDTANYTDAPALLCCYGCNGMDENDTNSSKATSYKYGPNIIAAMEVIFGSKTPHGRLPVEIPSVKKSKMDISDPAFELGFGIDLAETQPKETRKQTNPTSAENTTSTTPKAEMQDNKSDFEENIFGYIFVGAACLIVLLFIVFVIVSIVSSKRKKKAHKSAHRANKR